MAEFAATIRRHSKLALAQRPKTGARPKAEILYLGDKYQELLGHFSEDEILMLDAGLHASLPTDYVDRGFTKLYRSIKLLLSAEDSPRSAVIMSEFIKWHSAEETEQRYAKNLRSFTEKEVTLLFKPYDRLSYKEMDQQSALRSRYLNTFTKDENVFIYMKNFADEEKELLRAAFRAAFLAEDEVTARALLQRIRRPTLDLFKAREGLKNLSEREHKLIQAHEFALKLLFLQDEEEEEEEDEEDEEEEEPATYFSKEMITLLRANHHLHAKKEYKGYIEYVKRLLKIEEE